MHTCSLCKDKNCENGILNNLPLNCPCNETEEMEKIKELYSDEVNYKLAYNSALVESEGYCKKTRLEEIMDFANKCGYKNLGLAFCIGLASEAKTLYNILKHNGFEVNSIVCKNGSVPKEFLKIDDNQKVIPGTFEPICNPIGQAMFLNNAHTDFNIMLGLCVGHDSLFFKHSKAPVTVLAVKDRVLGHNPIAALYTSNSYYNEKLYPEKK